MIPAAFDVRTVRSRSTRRSTLLGRDEDAKLLAGGHSLIPLLRLRFARPSLLVDIGRLDDLRYVRDDGDRIAIGALTRHARARRSTPSLEQRLLRRGANGRARRRPAGPPPRARSAAPSPTRDPASDLATMLLTLDADFVARGPDGERTIAGGVVLRGAVRDCARAAGGAHRDPRPEGRAAASTSSTPAAHRTGRPSAWRQLRRGRHHPGGAREHGPDAAPRPCGRGRAHERRRSRRGGRTLRRGHGAAERHRGSGEYRSHLAQVLRPAGARAALGAGLGWAAVATATAGAFRDLPRRRRGSSGGIPLLRNPASRASFRDARLRTAWCAPRSSSR